MIPSDRNRLADREPSQEELADVEEAFPAPEATVSAKLQPLIKLGKSQGYVTTDAILEFRHEQQIESLQLENICAELFEAGIEVLDVTPPIRQENEIPAAEALEQIPEEAQRASAEDPLRLYLQEIARVPLLSPQQEAELGRCIAEASLAGEILRGEEARLSLMEDAKKPPQERMPCADRQDRKTMVWQGEKSACILNPHRAVDLAELKNLLARGEDARRRFCEANLRLVVRVAKRYAGRGLSLLDLIQEGNIGLLRAVEKFDYTKGSRFSSYAIWWIRQAITRALADLGRTIRIPGHIVQILIRLSRASRQLQQKLGRDPNAQELGDETGLSEEIVLALLSASKEPISLQMPFGQEGDGQLADLIEDRKAEKMERVTSRKLLSQHLDQALDTLTEREREIVALRFGLQDGRYRTLEEIGRMLGVNRERIRQLESRALRKLRHPSRSTKLHDYLES